MPKSWSRSWFPLRHVFHYPRGLIAVRRASQRDQRRAAQADLFRRRARVGRQNADHRRNRPSVQPQLSGNDSDVRQQHQHARWRHAPFRLQNGADPRSEQLCAQEQPPEGERDQLYGRRCARGAVGGDLRQTGASAVRVADESETGQQRRRRHRQQHRRREADRIPGRKPRRRQARHRQGADLASAPATPPAKPPIW